MKTEQQIKDAIAELSAMRDENIDLHPMQEAMINGMIVGLAWCRDGEASTLDRLLTGEAIARKAASDGK